jgi:hypothetical protein
LSSQTNGVSKSLKTKTRTELELGARCWWLTSVILATQEAEIRKLVVQGQPRQIVLETLSQKTHHKKKAGGMAEGVDPEFKPQYCKKKRNICV